MGKDKDLSSDTCLKQTVTNEDLITLFLETSLEESLSWSECLHGSAATFHRPVGRIGMWDLDVSSKYRSLLWHLQCLKGKFY